MAHHSQVVLFASTFCVVFLAAATSANAQQRQGRVVSELDRVQWHAQFEASGMLPFLTDLVWHEKGFYAEVKDVVAFAAYLESRLHIGTTGNFRRGWLHGRHSDIGAKRLDYRSDRGSLGPGSMQIVFSRRTAVAFLDVDLYNPYEDIVSFFAHAREVFRNRLRVR